MTRHDTAAANPHCIVTLDFRMHRAGAIEARSVPIGAAIIAGWTGRDPVAREKHIVELEALGVARPATTPIYYRVSAARLTTARDIEVSGEDSSGEVEFVLVSTADGLWVGLGSDHTDRKLETYNVTFSKQLCDKPIAPELWSYEDVRDHWDDLILRSWIDENGGRRLYQEGPVKGMLPPEVIIGGFSPDGLLAPGSVMFGGTLAAKGGIRPSKRFSCELHDPVRDRRITHDYGIATLPVVG
jgi:hypothetical protein